MIQGTASDVGKSLLVAGLCRLYARRGLRVAPFKPLNMSNNAAVAADGGEIGRAQALQALAAGRPASVHMNPLLLKPQGDGAAQVVLQGEVVGTARAGAARPPDHRASILDSFRRICREADLVLVEGAGAAVEPNLRGGNIANMGFAAALDLPVVMLADIERGGVFASLLGTHLLLDDAERARVCGFVINKFRGRPALFADGAADLADRTGWPHLGVVPWFDGLDRLPAEDAVVLGRRRTAAADPSAIRIAVPALPHIANFDDFDPLAAEADVALELIAPGSPLPGDADLVILPGSKATLADLACLRAEGWDIDLQAHLRRGGHVLGICAGLQMLGRSVADPGGLEGTPGRAAGLGLLDLETELIPGKRLVRTAGIDVHSGEAVQGYEMHNGVSLGPALARPMLRLKSRPDGALSDDGRVMGCYLHGLFAADTFRHAFLQRFRAGRAAGPGHDAAVNAVLDAWAAHLDACLEADALLRRAGDVARVPGVRRGAG